MSKEPTELDSESPRKPSRRLRPDAAALLARLRDEQLQELYVKPVESLEPDEIARMKAAFFRG
ncbi:MAG: hypothetical protein LBG44_11965 [Gemmatimonadota bacterium]|nr:hypothetical protein [Gemmatimonadota bacterium]